MYDQVGFANGLGGVVQLRIRLAGLSAARALAREHEGAVPRDLRRYRTRHRHSGLHLPRYRSPQLVSQRLATAATQVSPPMRCGPGRASGVCPEAKRGVVGSDCK